MGCGRVLHADVVNVREAGLIALTMMALTKFHAAKRGGSPLFR
jgi:hypothetical protein